MQALQEIATYAPALCIDIFPIYPSLVHVCLHRDINIYCLFSTDRPQRTHNTRTHTRTCTHTKAISSNQGGDGDLQTIVDPHCLNSMQNRFPGFH